MFKFGYPAFVAEFRKSAASLAVPTVVPYQARHSGPSIDLVLRRRDLTTAKKRGRWRTDCSVRRYEKAGCLQKEADRWTAGQSTHFSRSEGLVEELILGREKAQLPLTVR